MEVFFLGSSKYEGDADKLDNWLAVGFEGEAPI